MAEDLDSLKVKAITRDRVPNDYPGGELPWQIYHTVRNALVRTCRRFGPTGPMGLIKIVPDVENPLTMLTEYPDFWERGDLGVEAGAKEPRKSLIAVRRWTWTSRPMTVR